MDDTPISAGDARNLRFLRLLVTVLTATMILGLLTIVVLLVIRLGSGQSAVVQVPDTILLPDGVWATAFTQGTDWYAVVTDTDEILIYDTGTAELRQRVQISSD